MVPSALGPLTPWAILGKRYFPCLHRGRSTPSSLPTIREHSFSPPHQKEALSLLPLLLSHCTRLPGWQFLLPSGLAGSSFSVGQELKKKKRYFDSLPPTRSLPQSLRTPRKPWLCPLCRQLCLPSSQNALGNCSCIGSQGPHS